MTYLKKALWKARLSRLGEVRNHLLDFERWQWFDRDQLQSLQQYRLDCLLRHAFRHVPYYHEILRSSGVMDNAGNADLACFHRIPLLDKGTIRARYTDLTSDDIADRTWHKSTSGGSTGEPITLLHDSDCRMAGAALKILNDTWSGFSQGEKKVILWGSERDLLVGKETLRVYLSRLLRNELWLNSYMMTNTEMLRFVEAINTFKPKQILAYVESIYELALFIERRGLRVHRPGSILTSAGTLLDHMKDKIETIFGAPTFNRYGSREVGDIACECEQHMGLHVSGLSHLVEILRGDGTPAAPEEEGEIVITLLTNYAMPLVRYRIGDTGSWHKGPCSCGRSWPLLARVTGRVTDNFMTKDGGLIYGGRFRQLLFHHDWIRKFQIIQEDLDLFRIRLVPHGNSDGELRTREIQDITENIRLIMGRECRVEFEFVQDIQPSASGKYLHTISRVKERSSHVTAG